MHEEKLGASEQAIIQGQNGGGLDQGNRTRSGEIRLDSECVL